MIEEDKIHAKIQRLLGLGLPQRQHFKTDVASITNASFYNENMNFHHSM